MAGSEDPWFWSSCSEYANQQDALPAAFAGLARPRPRGPTTSFWDEWRSRSDTGSGLDDEASHPACGCGVSPGVDEMESAAAPN